jgi:hypothetical protein
MMSGNAMTEGMNRAALLLAIIAMPLTIAGCGDSDSRQTSAAGKPATGEDASRLCTAIEASGLARQCTISSRFNTIGVIIDSNDDEVGRNVCAAIANRFSPLTSRFSGHWKLQVFSPYRSDKAMASCPLY